MFPEPEYAQQIVVGVMFHGTFAWYVTRKEYWYLDYPKYDRAFLAAGYKSDTLGDYSLRFGIGILNEDTAEQFLSRIEDRRVPTSALSEMMIARGKADEGDDMLDFLPCLFVNFDQKQLLSQYPEMIAFENYVPDGWIGEYRDFTPEVPEDMRYWMAGEHNLFYKKE